MEDITTGRYKESITGKIIIAVLIACIAISFTIYISNHTFNRLLTTVRDLTKPNEKTELVNQLFRELTELDQMQSAQAMKTERLSYNPFLKESRHIQLLLDSLGSMKDMPATETRRIDSMKELLLQRDVLFLRYVRQHADLIKNDTLVKQVERLSGLLNKTKRSIDSGLANASKNTRIIIDTLSDDAQQENLWKRIFAKRKARQKRVKRQIEEHVNVALDTLFDKNKDSLEQIGVAISRTSVSHKKQSELLVSNQSNMNKLGDALLVKAIDILNDIEQDILAEAAKQNEAANRNIAAGITNILIVMAVFIIAVVVLVILIISDVARSRRYKRELIEAKEEAEEAGLVKQRFLANMSHELRTPLQSIIGMAEQVQSAHSPDKQQVEYIYQSSLHLLQIVNEVLDYSRITSGIYSIDNKPFNMSALIREVAEMIRVQTTQKALEFKVNIPADDNTYYIGDPFRIRQILLNLLGNAVKYTDSGAVSLNVSMIDKGAANAHFLFEISDTGVGISEKDIDVIFNRFEQAGDVSKQKGTGLGLSIVKALVELLGGTIHVKSNPGNGSVFTVALAFARYNGSVDEAGNNNSWQPGTYNGHIWIVDDDKFILQLCDTILNKYEIAHTCFNTPAAALAAAAPNNLKLVMLDIRMDEMSGIALCQKLKQQLNDDIRYIALTAHVLPNEQELLLTQGFDMLLMKPFMEKDMLQVIYEAELPVVAAEVNDGFFSGMRRMAGNDHSLFNRSLNSFITATKEDVRLLNNALEENDIAALQDILHRLASRCALAGDTTLAMHLRSIEIELREDSASVEAREGLVEAMEDIEILLAAAQTALKS